jgi:hypothetical protein
MSLIGEGIVSVIGAGVIGIIGFLVLYVTGAYDVKEVGSIFAGILWGSTIPILTWGFRYKIKFRGKIAKWLRFFDPLKGEPEFINDGIRHYSLRDKLPSMSTLLSMKELESLEILAITHYLLVLNYIDSIKNALERDVKITIYILDPDDTESITTQTRNYGRKDIKKQIETTLSELYSINKNNLHIQKYRKVIGQGVVKVQLNNSLSWIKVETYVNQTEANSRPAQACYKKDNKDFYDKWERYLKEVTNSN